MSVYRWPVTNTYGLEKQQIDCIRHFVDGQRWLIKDILNAHESEIVRDWLGTFLIYVTVFYMSFEGADDVPRDAREVFKFINKHLSWMAPTILKFMPELQVAEGN